MCHHYREHKPHSARNFVFVSLTVIAPTVILAFLVALVCWP